MNDLCTARFGTAIGAQNKENNPENWKIDLMAAVKKKRFRIG